MHLKIEKKNQTSNKKFKNYLLYFMKKFFIYSDSFKNIFTMTERTRYKEWPIQVDKYYQPISLVISNTSLSLGISVRSHNLISGIRTKAHGSRAHLNLLK